MRKPPENYWNELPVSHDTGPPGASRLPVTMPSPRTRSPGNPLPVIPVIPEVRHSHRWGNPLQLIPVIPEVRHSHRWGSRPLMAAITTCERNPPENQRPFPGHQHNKPLMAAITACERNLPENQRPFPRHQHNIWTKFSGVHSPVNKIDEIFQKISDHFPATNNIWTKFTGVHSPVNK